MDTIDKINYYLVKQGKTGADLSRALGLSNSIYSQWNKKKTKPKTSKLSVIAEYLGVSVADILPDDEEVLPKAKKESAPDPKTEGEGLSAARQKLYDAIANLTDEQCTKLLGVVEWAKENK